MDQSRVHEILEKVVKVCGNQARAGQKIGVREETVRSWRKHPEKHIQQDNVERILEVANQLRIEVGAILLREPLWDATLTYEKNLEQLVPAAPQLTSPFKTHAVPAFGRILGSPLAGAASVVTSTSDRIRYLAETGVDTLFYKTVRSRAYQPHPWPNLYYCNAQVGILEPGRKTPKIMVGSLSDVYRPTFGSLNWFGMPSSSVEAWTADFKTAKGYLKPGQLLILSVVGTIDPGMGDRELIADFVKVVQLAVDAGADIVELNLSCPNTKTAGGKLFKNIELVRQICTAIRQHDSKTQLILKIGFMTGTDLERFVLQTADYVQGYSAINTLPVEGVRQGQETLEPAFNREMLTGLSGRPILQHGLKCVKELAAIKRTHRLNHVIIGVGGVSSPPDVLAYLDAGAQIVAAANAFIDNPNFGIEARQFLDVRLPAFQNGDRSQEHFGSWLGAFVQICEEHSIDDKQGLEMCARAFGVEFSSWYVSAKRDSSLGQLRVQIAREECYKRMRVYLNGKPH